MAKVSAVPRRPQQPVRSPPAGAAGLYVGCARGRRRLQQLRELRGGNRGQAPPRAGRDGSLRVGRRALRRAGTRWAGSLRAGKAGRVRFSPLRWCGADTARLLVDHRPERGKAGGGPGCRGALDGSSCG